MDRCRSAFPLPSGAFGAVAGRGGENAERKYFTESNNSLHETVAAIDLLSAVS
jgi:hypothetical protein